MVDFALRILREGDWVLMPNDKEGGWCILRRPEAVRAHRSVLSSHLYVERLCAFDNPESGAKEYARLCKVVQEVEQEDGLAMYLRKGFRCDDMVAKLSTLLKATKTMEA